MKKIDTHDFQENVFTLIGEDYFLLLAEKDDGSVNAMTAQWGNLGFLWGQNVALIYVRPQRYTYDFVTGGEKLSLNFFDPKKYREMLRYFGMVSGRDEDKIAKQNLTVLHTEEGLPYFAEARFALTARKLYSQMLNPDGFHDLALRERIYPAEDYHLLLVAGIADVLVADEL